MGSGRTKLCREGLLDRNCHQGKQPVRGGCWEKQSRGCSLSTSTRPHKNGFSGAWNTSSLRDKELVGLVAWCGNIFPCFRYNEYSLVYRMCVIWHLLYLSCNGDRDRFLLLRVQDGCVSANHLPQLLRETAGHEGPNPTLEADLVPALHCVSKALFHLVLMFFLATPIPRRNGQKCLESSPGAGNGRTCSA